MSMPTDPVRLRQGGLVDGHAASAEMLELVDILRGATEKSAGFAAIRAGATSGTSWGRWLVMLALALGFASGAVSAGSLAPLDEPRPSDTAPAFPSERAPTVAVTPVPSSALAGRVTASTTSLQGRSGVEASAAAAAPPAPRATLAAAPEPRRRPRRSRGAARLAAAADLPTPMQIAPDTSSPSDALPSPLAAVAPGVVASADAVADGVALDDAAPSELYASALADYARGCCDCAVTPLQHVIEGSTADSPRAVRRAELLLGVCLARMGWTQSALSVLEAIVETGPEHPYFSEALTELARLGPELPDPSVLVETFAHDDEARLVGEEPAVADAAAYLQGRARYHAGDLTTAVRLFARVSAASPFHRAARFYEGLTEVRLRHAGRAEAAFRAVIDTSPEGDRHRDLATLALARLYYAAAESRHAAGDDERESELLTQALEAWRRVPLTSEHFLDAFFEESWALYLAGEDSRALGHVFGLLSPFFETTEHPEAWVVRGTIHFEHCLYDEADEDVREFHARYDDVLASLAELVSIGDDAALALYATRAAALTGPTRSLVGSSIFDRDAERRSEHLRAIEAESARLSESPFARNTLGERLAQELGVSAALARSRMAEGVRERLSSARDALVERANEIDRIALETTTARRDVLTGGAVLSEESAREREIIADLGVEVWPFDGEYWADEVTSYREVIRDRCGR